MPNLGIIVFAHTRIYRDILLWEMKCQKWKSRVGTAIREAWILALAEYVRDCWSRVTSQKQWHQSAHHILDIGHVKAGGWGWFIQLDHSSVLHRPLDRQFGLFNRTEGKNQGVYYVIRAGFVGSVFRQSSILWSQNAREEKLGTVIVPESSKGTSCLSSSTQKG